MSSPGYLDTVLEIAGATRAWTIVQGIVVLWPLASSIYVAIKAPFFSSEWLFISSTICSMFVGSFWFYRSCKAVWKMSIIEEAGQHVTLYRALNPRPTPLFWKISAPLAIALFFALLYFVFSMMIAYTGSLIGEYVGRVED